MGATEWIGVGTVVVALAAVMGALLHGDRSLARIQAVAEARALEALVTDQKQKAQLTRYIAFTIGQIGDVWWRTPFAAVGMFALVFALVNFGIALAVAISPTGAVGMLFVLAAASAVIGILVLVIAEKKGR